MFARKPKINQEEIAEKIAAEKKREIIKAIEQEYKINAHPTKAIMKSLPKPQQVDFSFEQELLSDLFGGGEKIWNVPDSTTGVKINRTLYSGDTQTGALFGMGNTKPVKDNETARMFF